MSDNEIEGASKVKTEEMMSDMDRVEEVKQEFIEESAEFQLTPEVEAMISEKLQDILETGIVSHGTRYLNSAILENMITEGLKSRTDIEKDGDSAEGMFDFTIFPHHVSFSLSMHDVDVFIGPAKNNIVLDDKFLKFMFGRYASKAIENSVMGFIGGEEDRDPIRFVGVDLNNYGKFGEGTVNNILSTAQKKGWISAIQYGSDDMFKELFIGLPGEKDVQFASLSAHDNEIIIDPQCFHDYLKEIHENPIGGIVLEGNQGRRKHLFSRLSELCSQSTQNFVLVYNENGDLLWPKKMSYEEVKAFVAGRDAKKEAESPQENQETE